MSARPDAEHDEGDGRDEHEGREGRETGGGDRPGRARPSQRTLIRNWDELLQEIRVTQTGVQILTGFLLTVPFSQRFEQLTAFQRGLYLAVLLGSVVTTGLVVAPVAFHRVLFRRRRRELLVESGNRLALAGLAMLAVTVSGVVTLVVDIVVGAGESFVAGGLTLALLAALWAGLPRLADRLDDDPRNEAPEADGDPET
jgi:hypothetical protein